jgi:hypothetical protein
MEQAGFDGYAVRETMIKTALVHKSKSRRNPSIGV